MEEQVGVVAIPTRSTGLVPGDLNTPACAAVPGTSAKSTHLHNDPPLQFPMAFPPLIPEMGDGAITSPLQKESILAQLKSREHYGQITCPTIGT